LQIVADLVKELDDTRPRIVSRFSFDRYHTELSDSHYTVPSAIAKEADKARHDQRHHCRGGFARNGACTLIVNKQTSPPQDISASCVPDLYLALTPGDKFSGTLSIGSNQP
jgi:hypothetical protein